MKANVLISICSMFFSMSAMQQDYSLKLLTGKDIQAIIAFMVEQRIVAFREYPYLYEGNKIEGSEYCTWLASLPTSAVAVAYRGDQPVGFVSGTAFNDFDSHFSGSADLLRKNGLSSHEFYYIPEAIIVKEHRGAALIVKLHCLIERHAKALGYKTCCFVDESHDKHPLKPVDYKPLDGMFHKAGYNKTDMIICHSWLTIQAAGAPKNEIHSLCYWVKNV